MTHAIALDVRSGATVGALLGAFVELGASLADVDRDLASLGAGAIPIAVRRSAAGTNVRVHAPRETPPLRPWSEQRDRLALLAVAPRVSSVTLAVLERLARARSVVRGIPLGEVEADPFGGLDELAGALALGSALASLGSPDVLSTAVGVGSGAMSTVFGELVLPGPVVTEILADRRVVALPFAVDLVDPVAAAFVAASTTQLTDDASVVATADDEPGRGAVHTRDGDVGEVLAAPVGAARTTDDAVVASAV